jgi:ABC-2 type transport system permease protein
MTGRILGATSARVLRQLRHDPRTIALLLVVPSVLMGLLAWILIDVPGSFDRLGLSLLGVFPLIVMFMVTAVATLRERTTGTMERLLATPAGKADIVLGYGVAFGLAATIQAIVVAGLSFGLFGLDAAGPFWAVVLVAVSVAVLGTALGLGASSMAATEFQAAQLMPAVILPQLLLCGLVIPRDQLPGPLEALSNLLPMSYAVDAMQQLTTSATVSSEIWRDLAVIAGFTLAALVLGATTLRRRTP